MASEILTAEQAQNLFIYDPETGEFISRIKSGSRPAGVPVGRPHSRGYIQIHYRKRHYYAHRLAWLYMTGSWPEGQIDHINGLRDDNRFCNLRDVTQSRNMLNQKAPLQRNKVGILGISKVTRSDKYVAQFTFEGQKITVGYFRDPHEAKREYDRVKSFMCASPHAKTLKRLVGQKDLSPNGLRSVIDLIG